MNHTKETEIVILDDIQLREEKSRQEKNQEKSRQEKSQEKSRQIN